MEYCWKLVPKGNAMFSVWKRLKLIKSKINLIRYKELKGIQEKIDQARLQLENIQTQLQTHPDDGPLLVLEQDCSANLRKWLKIEESALRQKSRLQWLHSGDSNNIFSLQQ